VTLRLTLKLEGDLDILKMYVHSEKTASLRHSELKLELKKIRKYVSRSKVKIKMSSYELLGNRYSDQLID